MEVRKISNKIKGLTIEIGGNTVLLQKSMGEVNARTRDLKSELRDVERLLKLDPSNTELLAQKQKILTGSIEATKDKLNQLKQAEKEVQEQFERGEVSEEQFRALQREVIKTEGELKKLEKSSKDFGTSMTRELESASKSMKEFGKKSEDLGKKLGPVSAVAAGTGAAALKMASDFTNAMAKVDTIASGVPLDQLRKDILALSSETGIAAEIIANNVYDAISAGQDTADAVDFVSNATKLAKAGFAEAGQSLDILTTIMNAYGMESEKVGEVSDMLIQIQNKGKVTVGELSAAMGKVIPTANAMNVGLDQLGAGYAILTSNGIKAAEATTYMNAMLNEMGKSGTKTDKVLKELTGKGFKDLSAEGKSVGDILSILKDNAEANNQSLADMFGSAEAGKAALVLLKDGADGFNESVSEMKDSAGATQSAFEKLQTPGEKSTIALNKLKNVMIQLGDVGLPVLAKIADFVGKVADKLLGMNETTRTVIVIMLALVASIAPVLIIVGKLATGISAIMGAATALTPVISSLGLVVGSLAVPVGAIILAIGAVIGVMKLWEKYNEEIKDFLSETWNSIQEFLSEKLITIQETFAFAWEAISKAFSAFGKLFKGDFKGFLNEIWQAAKTWVLGWADIGRDIVGGIWEGISGMASWLAEKVTGFFGSIVDAAKSAVGINSPSTVFRDEVGKNMALGIGVGFTDTMEAVKTAMSDSLKTSSSEVYTDNRINNNSEIKLTQNIYTPVKNERALARATERNLRKILVTP